MWSRTEIERLLNERIEHTHGEYVAARQEFRNARDDLPSSLPLPDGSSRISNTGDAYTHAIRAYSIALREFHELIWEEKIPDWVNERGEELRDGSKS